MATPAELKRWNELGGKVEDAKGRKIYVAPSGKRLRTWKEANRIMDEAEESKEDGASNACFWTTYSECHIFLVSKFQVHYGYHDGLGFIKPDFKVEHSKWVWMSSVIWGVSIAPAYAFAGRSDEILNSVWLVVDLKTEIYVFIWNRLCDYMCRHAHWPKP